MRLDGAAVVDAVDLSGLRIAFQREGRGPPWCCCTASRVWRRQLGLSDRGAVGTGSQLSPGTVRSRPSISRAGIVPVADYADCLFGFLRALDFDHPCVAGVFVGVSWRWSLSSAGTVKSHRR